MPLNNTDIWMPNSVSMVVWRRMTGVKSDMERAALYECLLCAHKRMTECVGAHVSGHAGMGSWTSILSMAVGFCKWNCKNILDSQSTWLKYWLSFKFSLCVSQVILQRERERQATTWIFCLKTSPAANIISFWQSSLNSYSRVNIPTAFQAQAFCGYLSVFYQAFHCINTHTGSTQHALEAKRQHHSGS